MAKYIPEVFAVCDAAVEDYTADGYAQAVKAVVEAKDVKGVLIPHTYDGVDYAAKAAMAIGAGIVSNCNKAVVEGGKLVLTRNIYNGKLQETKSVTTDKFVVTFEKGAYDPAEAGGAGAVSNVAVSFACNTELKLKKLSRHLQVELILLRLKSLYPAEEDLKTVTSTKKLLFLLHRNSALSMQDHVL